MLTQTQTSASSSVLPPPLYRYHPSAFPPVLPCLPHPPYRPSLRHPLWCPPNQPPTRSLVALPPAAAAAATAAVAPPPRPCRLSTHRPAKPLVAVPPSHPTYRLPHYPAASDPHPSPLARQPPACLPACLPADSSSLCATLRSLGLFSLPTAVPRCGPRPFLSSPCPATTSRRPASPPSGNQHTRKPCAVEHDRQLRDYLLSDRMSRVYACERMRKG